MAKLKKLAVGAAGGIAGAALMGQVHIVTAKVTGLVPPQGEDATEKVANSVAMKLTGRKLEPSKRKAGGQIVHFTFGAVMGALYALLATRLPSITFGGGAIFGTAIYVGAHALTVPALGLASNPLKSSGAQEAAEFSAHVVYGITTETVRRFLS
jgi:hypothetical protein